MLFSADITHLAEIFAKVDVPHKLDAEQSSIASGVHARDGGLELAAFDEGQIGGFAIPGDRGLGFRRDHAHHGRRWNGRQGTLATLVEGRHGGVVGRRRTSPPIDFQYARSN